MIQKDGRWGIIECGSRCVTLLGFLPLSEGDVEVAKIVPMLGIVGVELGDALGCIKSFLRRVILLLDSGEKCKEFEVVLIFFEEF